MAILTSEGERIVGDLSQRHGISTEAVTHLLMAVNNGYGTQAQFNHPELGGMGQWSKGGMTMVGDMFNNGLRYLVEQLCNALSAALANETLIQSISYPSGPSGSFQMQGSNRWPEDLGQPSSTGAQNDLRYAVFPQTRRLAIDANGQISVYDTGDHNITGFSQQQSGDQSITFTSQYGMVRVADLTLIAPKSDLPAPEAEAATEPSQPPAPQEMHYDPGPIAPVKAPGYAPDAGPVTAPAPTAGHAPAHSRDDAEEIIELIEKLASLHNKGILTDTEFDSKKAELLSRL